MNIECTKDIIDPSNSVPASVLMVIGENDLQKIFSQILEAMKSEVPCPSPYPFYNKSSNKIQITPATTNYKTIIKQHRYPRSATGPYYPE